MRRISRAVESSKANASFFWISARNLSVMQNYEIPRNHALEKKDKPVKTTIMVLASRLLQVSTPIKQLVEETNIIHYLKHILLVPRWKMALPNLVSSFSDGFFFFLLGDANTKNFYFERD